MGLMPRTVQIVHHQTKSVIEDDDDVAKNTLNIPIHMELGKGKSNINVEINSRRSKIGNEPSVTSEQQRGIFSESETLREVTERKNRNRFGKVPVNVLRSGTKNAATQT